MRRSDTIDPKSDADVKTETEPLEPVDTDAIPYIETLVGAGDRGFAPVGWVYLDIMRNLCRKGFAYSDGLNCFRVSGTGRAELEKHRRNEARRPPKEAAP
jgi:hypothetical protein